MDPGKIVSIRMTLDKINDDDLFSIVAPIICSRFDVSAEVIERRLRAKANEP
jgi:hypothetical protein